MPSQPVGGPTPDVLAEPGRSPSRPAAPRLVATVVTFRRRSGLERVLNSIADQRLAPTEIVVVDNDADAAVGRICGEHPARDIITYLPTRENLGPAGGTARAMQHFLDHYGVDDWLTRVDDDHPVLDVELLGDLVDLGNRLRARGERVGGVGLSGACWDRHSARLTKVPVPAGEDAVRVDYLSTNFFPVYSGAAIADGGVMDAALFFGMSEVEYGLRLAESGWSLWLHGPRVHERRRVGSGVATSPPPRHGLDEADWRRYYSLRNSIVVARHHGGVVPAARVTLARAIGKPLVNLPRTPRRAWVHLQLGTRAASDAWRGRMGRRLDPVLWEQQHRGLRPGDDLRDT